MIMDLCSTIIFFTLVFVLSWKLHKAGTLYGLITISEINFKASEVVFVRGKQEKHIFDGFSSTAASL